MIRLMPQSHKLVITVEIRSRSPGSLGTSATWPLHQAQISVQHEKPGRVVVRRWPQVCVAHELEGMVGESLWQSRSHQNDS